MDHRRIATAAGIALLVGFLGCSGAPGSEPAQDGVAQAPQDTGGVSGGVMGRGGMMGGGMMGGMMGAPADTAAAPRPEVATASAAGCPDVSQSTVDVGRRIFTGAGNCFACHGSDAHGTTLAPNLTDSDWLNIDGSYDAIVELVRRGVPQPKQAPAPMPPLGGAQLDSTQVCEVASYVFSLSH